MTALTSFFTSSIGKKFLMAISGVGLIGFIVAHLIGNLLIFGGQEALNAYAKGLHDLGGLLWIARIGLITIFVVHIGAAIALTRDNRAARPDSYQSKGTVKASLASKNMGLSGSFILLFVIGHLLHFTWGVIQPESHSLIDAQGRHDVYSMVVTGFSNLFVSIPYIFSLILLGAHLSHAMSSFFQTLGFNHPTYTPLINKGAPMLAMAITIGYLAIPVSVICKIITL